METEGDGDKNKDRHIAKRKERECYQPLIDTDRQGDRDKQTGRHRETTETDRETQRKDRDRDTKTGRQGDREKTDTEIYTQAGKQKTETETEADAEIERDSQGCQETDKDRVERRWYTADRNVTSTDTKRHAHSEDDRQTHRVQRHTVNERETDRQRQRQTDRQTERQ